MAGLRRALLGYSSSSVAAVLADREHMFELASKDARSAAERADRLATELREIQARLDEAEERSAAAQEIGESLAVELERSVAHREAMEAKLTVLGEETAGVTAALAVANASIASRDAELREASERMVALEAQMAERARDREDLGHQLAAARSLAAGLKDELAAEQGRRGRADELLETYRAELRERPPAAPESAAVGPSSARELAAVLQVTEEAVIRIMESTRARADEELREVDRDRERIGRDVEAMRTWRDRAAPTIATMQSTLQELVAHASSIGTQIGDVLRPVALAATRLGADLSSLDGLAPTSVADAGAPGQGARIIELRDDQTAERRREG
jgi:chromosome segregation protein